MVRGVEQPIVPDAGAIVAVDNPMDGVGWKPPGDGGYVLRHGAAIGRLTTWGKNLSIKCYMHGCSVAVTSKTPCENAVAWLVAVPPVHVGLSPSESATMNARLKDEHMKLPKPKP